MRALRALVIVVVVLGVLFVVADRVTVGIAEDKAAEKLRASQGLSSTPSVSIKGFPFLTQVVGGTLDEVDAELGGIEAGPDGSRLRIEQLNAQFHGVRLSSDYTSVEGAAGATGTARISYTDLTAATGNGVRVSYGGEKSGGGGRVSISPNVSVMRSLEVRGTVSTPGGNTVRLRVDSVPVVCTKIPGCERLVRERVDRDWRIDGLPSGLRLDRVVTTPDGIAIDASGTDVSLTR